jgi:hypothetical protein
VPVDFAAKMADDSGKESVGLRMQALDLQMTQLRKLESQPGECYNIRLLYLVSLCS